MRHGGTDAVACAEQQCRRAAHRQQQRCKTQQRKRRAAVQRALGETLAHTTTRVAPVLHSFPLASSPLLRLKTLAHAIGLREGCLPLVLGAHGALLLLQQQRAAADRMLPAPSPRHALQA